MKKLFLVFCALLTTAACTAPSPNTNTPPANTSSAAKEATISDGDLIAKEKETWALLEKKDLKTFGDMLAADYTEVGDDGVDDKAGVLDFLKDFEISAPPSFSDWKVTRIDDDAALLTYSVTLKSSYKGKAVPEGPYRSSAAWVKRDGKWVGIYYQETLVPKESGPPPPPPPAGSPAKSQTPATTAAAPPSDPEASEKAVWDALKRKDFDAFAGFLDAASIEVEPDGVYDKAGSVKTAALYDFSKFTLSDFKTVNFDSDATLVTYVVKSSNPKEPLERHSTIWVKRDGKWRALFHQSTPASAAAPASEAKPQEKKPA